MSPRQVYRVPPDEAGWAVRDILRKRLQVSRHFMSKLKQVEDGIVVNGAHVTVRYVVAAGDEVSIRKSSGLRAPAVAAVPGNLRIVFEDDDLLIVHKPPYQTMYPRYHGESGSLAEAVVYHLGGQQAFHPLTRLDKGTSGLVLVGKSTYATSRLQQTAIAKTYHAVVLGCPNETGIIEAPMRRVPPDARRQGAPSMEIFAAGQDARTAYRRLAYDTLHDAAALELDLHTGRRHQIRLHCAHIGHPLFGDVAYGGPSLACARPLLHAARLRFIHPLRHELMHFETEFSTDHGEPQWLTALFSDTISDR